MNLERATAPAAEDRPPDTWVARRRVVQPRDSGSRRGGRVLRRSANSPGLLPAADLHRPAGGDLLIGEPAAAAQEHLQDGLPHWARLRRVLPTGLPRLGLRGSPAQRGPAGGGVVLSRADDGGSCGCRHPCSRTTTAKSRSRQAVIASLMSMSEG